MAWLCIGVLIWMVVHFVPSLAPDFRQSLHNKFGEKLYKGLFALDILVAVVLMIYGWRTATPEIVYLPPNWGHIAALPLMAVSVFLFGAAQRPSMVKQFIRHPQLTALAVWSVAHLLANGDQKSLVLFGGLGIWALLEMAFINRRDGAWVKPESPGIGRDVRGVVIALIIFAVLAYLHPYFSGVTLIVR